MFCFIFCLNFQVSTSFKDVQERQIRQFNFITALDGIPVIKTCFSLTLQLPTRQII